MQRRFRPTFVLAAFALLVPLSPAGGPTELNAKPGGKVKVIHGAPTWREEFQDSMKPGLNWRLGSGGATVLDSEAGLIFEDCDIFPGEYNVALTCESGDRYAIVFHHDGVNWSGEDGKTEGKAVLEKTAVEGKQVAKQLDLALTKDPEKKGYVFRITFGPHRLQSAFVTAKAKTISGKAGKASFKSTYLERTDVEDAKKQLEAQECCVAQVERKDGSKLNLFLKAGSAPTLTVAGAKGASGRESIKGESQAAAKPTQSFVLVLGESEKGAKATFTLGENAWIFDLPESLFLAAPKR